MRALRLEHAITAAVALGLAGLGLAEGGFAPTAYGATAIVVWGAVLLGLATGALPRGPLPGAGIAAGLMLGGFAALTALSIAWASDNGRAFEDVVRALAYVGTFVLVLVASRRGEAAPWLRGIAIGLAAVAVIALAARFEPRLFGEPDADLRRILPAAAGRLTYPIGYWNGLAASMATAAVLMAWLAATSASRVARSLAVAVMPIVLLALWATGSRGGIGAAAIAFTVLVVFGPGRGALLVNAAPGVLSGAVLVAIALGHDNLFDYPGTPVGQAEAASMLLATVLTVLVTGSLRFVFDRPLGRLAALRPSRRALQATAAVGAIAALAAVVVVDPVERFEEFKAPPSEEEIRLGTDRLFDSGGSGRYQFWEAAVDAFAAEPLGGQGSGGYGPYWLEHRQYPLVATRAHSLLFETLAELGVVGAAFVVGFFAIAGWCAVSRCRRAVAVPELGPAAAVVTVGALAALVDWIWDLPAVFVPVVVAVALLTGAATQPPSRAGSTAAVRGEVRSRRRFAGGVGVLLVAWVAICAAGLLLLSDRALEASRDAAARGDLAAAFDAAADARDLEPWAAEPRVQLALLYAHAGDSPKAIETLKEAIDRAPRDFELYFTLALIQYSEGDVAESKRNFRIARSLNPLDPLVAGQPIDPSA